MARRSNDFWDNRFLLIPLDRDKDVAQNVSRAGYGGSVLAGQLGRPNGTALIAASSQPHRSLLATDDCQPCSTRGKLLPFDRKHWYRSRTDRNSCNLFDHGGECR